MGRAPLAIVLKDAQKQPHTAAVHFQVPPAQCAESAVVPDEFYFLLSTGNFLGKQAGGGEVLVLVACGLVDTSCCDFVVPSEPAEANLACIHLCDDKAQLCMSAFVIWRLLTLKLCDILSYSNSVA